MKAAYLTGIRKVEIRDIPVPAIRKGDHVLLRTAVAGLCGSDLHYFVSDRVGSEAVSYPAIVGHECSAVVEAVGSAVKRLKPGDRVAVEPSISCGECDQCRSGRPHTCRHIGFLGHPGERDGCFAEFFVLPERNLFPIPDAMSMTEAMLIEPLSIALHARSLAGGWLGPAVGVLGSGPIGLSLVQVLKIEGYGKTYATDRSDARASAAVKAGAVWSGNPERMDIVGEIMRREPLGLDAVFEVSGDPAAIEQAYDLVKPGGWIYQVGIPLAERMSYSTAKLRRKEIGIRHVRRQNRCIKRALLLVEAKHLDIAWLATHAFKIEETGKAFATAADRTDGVLKASIVF
ncbi:MAG: alcohol dehydrogenase catalytic domain-containing protein [Candidatus Aminicenantes bacterium]|nr:alcohol dehydrogenase catalytic domain-containing protein [Candidatus Aminicenantes bacterium]